MRLAQARAELAALDPGADLHPWAVRFFEHLTGERPSGAELPGQVVPGLDPRLDRIFRRGYERAPRGYVSARDALADLDAALAAPAPVAPPASGRRPLRAGVLARGLALGADALVAVIAGVASRDPRAAVAAFLLHDAVLTSLAGATLGKRLLGLRVEGGGLARTLLRALSIATVVGPLLALGREKRALHDVLAGTTVLRA